MLNLVRKGVAIAIRDSRNSYSRDPIGMLWTVIVPAMQAMIIIGVMFLIGRGATLGMPVLPFVAIGIIAWHLFRSLAFGAAQVGRSYSYMLTLPGITPMLIVVSRAMLSLVIYGVVMFGFLVALCIHEPWMPAICFDSAPMFVAVLLTIAAFALGTGLMLAPLLRSSIGQRLSPLVQRTLFFTSGIFFVTEMLPPTVRDIVLANPLVHGIQLLRDYYFVGYATTQADYAYLLGWTCVTCVLGLICYSQQRAHVLDP